MERKFEVASRIEIREIAKQPVDGPDFRTATRLGIEAIASGSESAIKLITSDGQVLGRMDSTNLRPFRSRTESSRRKWLRGSRSRGSCRNQPHEGACPKNRSSCRRIKPKSANQGGSKTEKPRLILLKTEQKRKKNVNKQPLIFFPTPRTQSLESSAA